MFNYSVASHGYAMTVVADSCRKDHESNIGKPPRKLTVSWDSSVLDTVVLKHNDLPSKGNFYKSRKEKTGIKYTPFSIEFLRICDVRAQQDAKILEYRVRYSNKESPVSAIGRADSTSGFVPGFLKLSGMPW